MNMENFEDEECKINDMAASLKYGKKQKKFEIFIGGLGKESYEEDLKIVGTIGEINVIQMSKNLPPLNQHFDQTMIAHVQLKAAQFFVESCYRLSLGLHEKEEIAEEIARLKDGLATLASARNWGKVESLAQLAQAASKLEGNINLNLKSKMRD